MRRNTRFAVMAALILTATVSVWRVRAQNVDQQSAGAEIMSKEWMYPGVTSYTHSANHVGGPIVEEYATTDAVEKVWRYYQEKIFPTYNRMPWPTIDAGELVQVATLTTKGVVGPANYSVPCERVNTCTIVIHRPADTTTVMVSRYPERKEVPFDTRILVIIDKHCAALPAGPSRPVAGAYQQADSVISSKTSVPQVRKPGGTNRRAFP